jgi:hypothetical protein
MNRFLVAITLTLALAACATTPVVYTDFDPAAQFGNYRTYSWSEEKTPQATPLMQQRIVNAIDAQLSNKGWSRVGSGGDVVVATSLANHQEYEIDSYSDPFWGPWGWGGWGGYGWGHGHGWGIGGGWNTARVRAYTVGTLAVDMYDARTKRAIWSGTAEGTVRRDPARQIADIQTAVTKMFATFPPGSMPAPVQ